MTPDIPVFTPYPHQQEDLAVMGKGCRRAVWVWHRRAGKDLASFLGWMIPEAFRVTGTYFYVFPTYAQGKKIIWDSIDSSGIPILHYIGGYLGLPWKEARHLIQLNETELQITLPAVQGGSQGSIIQLIGTDNMDRVVGTNPRGLIFSEYALQKPQVWYYMSPILEANGGWAMFVYTPRGRNHGYKLFSDAKKLPGWHVSRRTIQDTCKHDGSPIITMDQIDKLRAEGHDEDILQQEYFVSFAGAQAGSFYSTQMNVARAEGRIRPNLYDPNLPVDTFWDIGQSDSTVIGFRQTAYGERRWIDCYVNNKQGLDHYASYLSERARERHYRYRHHYFPHDMKVKEFTTGEARIEAARRLGIRPCSTIPKRPLFEGIDAVRRAMPKYWFDSRYCAELVEQLPLYHKKWDKEGKVFSDQPDHDESSHFADMVRGEAIIGDRYFRDEVELPKAATIDFDPFTYSTKIVKREGQLRHGKDLSGFDPFS